MNSNLHRPLLLAVFAAAALGAQTIILNGYVTMGYTWASSQVVYFVNPANSSGLSQSAALAAVQTGAEAWSSQSRANVALIYGGYTNGSAAQLNYKNEVFFRNTTGGAQSFWWYSGGHLVDGDIIIYEAGRPLFTGSEGCGGGVYVEDLATHEFGHVLGLKHSSDLAATMYPTTTYCSQNFRSLDADDIAGIEALYPPTSAVPPASPSQLAVTVNSASPTSSLSMTWNDNASNESGYRVERSLDGSSFAQVGQVGANGRTFTNSGLAPGTTYYYRVAAFNASGTSGYTGVAWGQTQSVATNTAPSVSIGNPLNNSAYPSTSTITFSGSAVDPQDGNVTSSLRWTSNVDGLIGTGGGFSRTLSPGSHVIQASASDAAGATGSSQISMTVTDAA